MCPPHARLADASYLASLNTYKRWTISMKKPLRNDGAEDLPAPVSSDTYSAFTRLLTPAEFAREIKMSESWLAKARVRGNGPPFVKIGKAVRYPDPAAHEWVRSQTRTSTSNPDDKSEFRHNRPSTSASVQATMPIRKVI